ncbi:Sulfite exporter TauE/SafE family [Methanonatronarchaeum thermophilum]|uniref:Probable membrane transporter protein n=1 Tax=Methanonatronarchaeum thermophilum TaxID=1927129 RepID=A0A1Y3GBT8_9EURY|nr:sulfite exporter TauE/SafE family protein [Methanonatronarchaeum thermophilum]OUJ18710.1 Sulfite exporter TauE/SafE family [Methanonatronarchaeum thermophilum]
MISILSVPIVLSAIAFLFSMLGRSGGTLYTPLFFWMGFDLKTQAIPLSIFLGFLTSSIAMANYSWKKILNWRIAIPLGLTMLIFSPLGAYFQLNIPEKHIIFILACFTALSVIPLLFEKTINIQNKKFNKKNLVIGLSGGASLGFFTAIIGRGGGTFIVPLLYTIGVKIKTAAAISSFAVACSQGSSLIAYLSLHAEPEWTLWIASILAVITGSLAGSKFMVESLSSRQIKWIFIIINLLIATTLIINDVILA